MTTLVKKTINGHVYWHAVQCARVNGKPRIVWEKHLGTTDAIVQAVTGAPPPKTAAQLRRTSKGQPS